MTHMTKAWLLLIGTSVSALGGNTDDVVHGARGNETASKPALRLLVPACFYPARPDSFTMGTT